MQFIFILSFEASTCARSLPRLCLDSLYRPVLGCSFEIQFILLSIPLETGSDFEITIRNSQYPTVISLRKYTCIYSFLTINLHLICINVLSFNLNEDCTYSSRERIHLLAQLLRVFELLPDFASIGMSVYFELLPQFHFIHFQSRRDLFASCSSRSSRSVSSPESHTDRITSVFSSFQERCHFLQQDFTVPSANMHYILTIVSFLLMFISIW